MDEAAAELRQLIEDHLARSKPRDPLLAVLCAGLGDLVGALQQAREPRPNWGAILGALRAGGDRLREALPRLREAGELSALLGFADRQLAFAELLRDEIIRLQAGESTLV